MRATVAVSIAFLAATSVPALCNTPAFRFDKDTFAFANMTVFEYKNGIPHLRSADDAKQKRYTRRCFVLSRSVVQFQKFARFDPNLPRVSDDELAKRIRAVTRHAAWKPAAAPERRIVIPGFASLRQLSEERGRLLQDNVGLGWPTYWRPGNYRMFFEQGRGYQKTTHERLNAMLDQGDLFVAYLTTLPRHFSINHAVLVYGRKPTAEGDRYVVYDSNHPEGPRELTWSNREQTFAYEKDWDFVGGPVRVYQVYGKPFQ